MPFDDDGEECDFCDLTLEEGEQFTDVRLGPLPQADKISVSETGNRRNRDISGKAAQGRVLMRALSAHPSFEVDGSNIVEEMKPVGDGGIEWSRSGEHGKTLSIDQPQFVTERHDDKVGVGLMVFPEPIESEPDARLCPRCKDLFE